MSLRLYIIVGTLMELCYLSFYAVTQGPGEVMLFIAVNAVTFLLLSFLVWRTRNATGSPEHERRTFLLLVVFGMVFRLTLVPHGVVGSDDIYRYLWDGKVAASGINPYLYFPTDPRLAQLANANLPSKVNHPELRSVYPPLAQGLFLVSHLLFGDSAAGWKFLLVVTDGFTILLLWLFLRERGKSTLPIMLYAWSPLSVLYTGLDGHIDALGITFLIGALYYLCTNRAVRGAVALGLSALVKFVPLLVVPLLARHLHGRRRWFLSALPMVMTVLGLMFFLVPAGVGTDSLRTFGEQWEFNGSIFSVIYFLTGSNDIAHLVSVVLIAVYIGVLMLVNRPLLEKVFWAFFGVILLSPVVHPWYLLWLAALLVLRWSTSAFVFLGLSTIANVVVYQYQAYGQWVDQPILLLIEYVPVVFLLVREIVKGEFLRMPTGENA